MEGRCNVPSIVRGEFFANVDLVGRSELWPTSDFLTRLATFFNVASRLHKSTFAYFDSHLLVEDTLTRISSGIVLSGTVFLQNVQLVAYYADRQAVMLHLFVTRIEVPF